MTPQPTADRRRHVRRPLTATVQLLHCPSGRNFPARSVDVSAGGMLMYVPVGAPVAPGQAVRLTVEEPHQPELANLGEAPLEATIVRVDRRGMLDVGHLPVGVRFRPSPPRG